MSRAYSRHDPYECPAIGVKHRERPKITIRYGHGMVEQRADYIRVGVAMCNHHPLRPGRSAAGIIDSQQVGFTNCCWPEVSSRVRQKSLIIQPAGPGAFQRDKSRYVRYVRSNAIDCVQVFRMGADNSSAAMLD